MPDALRATIELMNAPADAVKQRGSYNLAGVSFTPEQIAASIRRRIPGFTVMSGIFPAGKALETR